MIGIVAELITFLHRMLGDTRAAESIARDSYVKVKRLIDPSATSTGRALLFDTATKLAISYLRRRRAQRGRRWFELRWIGGIAKGEAAEEPVGIRHLEAVQRFEHHLNEVMQQLPEPTKQIYRLRHAERLTVPQIAERLKLSVNVVEQQLLRAGVLCQNELEKRGINGLDPE